MTRNLVRSGVLLAAAVLSVAGCSSTTEPEFQPVISNQTDDFQFTATGTLGATFEQVYTWQNTGTRARITHATLTQNGVARVVIMDASGETMYDSSLLTSGTADTPVGVAGAWTIELILTGFTGNLNFRLQKL